MSSHRGMTSEARQQAGVSDSLIRLSVGVEALEDLFADLDQAITG
jgi:cystathionine beta-lyase/cystathionine gamma-synthase